MPFPATLGKRFGLGLIVLLVAVAAFAAVRAWVVPRLIVAAVNRQYLGRVTIRDWWLNSGSAGVVGLALHEGEGADSPVWATADRVSTDLTLGGLLRGRTSPGKVVVEAPRIALAIDAANRVTTRIPLAPSGSDPAPLPAVEVRGGEATIRQEGRPEMIVKGAEGTLLPASEGSTLAARIDDPAWGRFEASGSFAPGFAHGKVELRSNGSVMTDHRRLKSLPFVPAETWAQIVPKGPADVSLAVEYGPEEGKAPSVTGRIRLQKTVVESTALGLTVADATGDVAFDGGVVRLEKVAGSALEGTIEADGTLDFTKAPPRFDLAMHLRKIDVADVPPSWQLGEAGITGLLTGQAQLRVVLSPSGADLTGSTGEASIEGGAIQGIPVKSLRLLMHAEGDDLQFESSTPRAALPAPSRIVPVRGRRVPIRKVSQQAEVPDEAPKPKAEAPKEQQKTKAGGPEPRKGGIRLPQTITTQIELEDVDLSELIGRAEHMVGVPIPLPITGKLDLKAEATLPLATLRDFRKYAFHGRLTLRGASIYRVDLGRVTSKIDLADGNLSLTEFQGTFDDRPDGGANNPPPALPEPKPGEPLAEGVFRGEMHASLSPPGEFSAQLEGNALPLGEIGAPFLPRPTPLSGRVSLAARVRCDLKAMGDPRSWTAAGNAESVRVSYQGAALDRLLVRFTLDRGRLDVAELSAQLEGNPLRAKGVVDLAAPHDFRAELDAKGWDLAKALAWLPATAKVPATRGVLTAAANGEGTLSPLRVQTKGDGKIGGFQVGPVPLGDVPFRWRTDEGDVWFEVVEAHSFGGTISARAKIPTTPGRPVEGSARAVGIDTALLSSALPGGELKLSGKADGQARFLIPADARAITSSLHLEAPGLTIQGIPAEKVNAAVGVENGALSYDVTADSLGGKIKFRGTVPLGEADADAPPGQADGSFQAAGFRLAALWDALGVTGMASRLHGLGAVLANVRIRLARGESPGIWAHGVAELRDVSWGRDFPIGHLKGTVAVTPTSWWVDPIGGEALGGVVSGSIRSDPPTGGARHVGMTLRVDRASLARVAAFVPALVSQLEGFGTLVVSATMTDAFRASIDVSVAQARLARLPITELRAPATLALTPGSRTGSLRIPRLSARVAGGEVRGNVVLRFGDDRSFRSEVRLGDLELETLSRLFTQSRQPASGKISGRVALTGADPSEPQTYRGRVALDLTDAALVQVPVFRELDRFLGSARGGIFEDGDLVGAVANRQLSVEALTLAGRLAQVHGTGTVTFDGRLNLEFLVNTNQIIPETGQALLAAIPGLREVIGVRQQAVARLANYFAGRLLKLRVTGTLRNPSIALDPSISVPESAVGFFAGVLQLPLQLIR